MILRDKYDIRDALKIQEMLIEEGIWASIPEVIESWEDFSNSCACSWTTLTDKRDCYWEDYVRELKEKIRNQRDD